MARNTTLLDISSKDSMDELCNKVNSNFKNLNQATTQQNLIDRSSGGGGGTNVHNDLLGRSELECHPTSSIFKRLSEHETVDLNSILDSKANISDVPTYTEILQRVFAKFFFMDRIITTKTNTNPRSALGYGTWNKYDEIELESGKKLYYWERTDNA